MFEKIVVGAGGSDTAAGAVEAARELAERFGATLHLVSVANAPALLAAAPDATAVAAAAEWKSESLLREEAGLRAAAASLSESGIEARAHVAEGDPAEALCDLATRLGADLIVVGNRGMKGARRVLGSVPNSVSHRAPCSVLIVSTT